MLFSSSETAFVSELADVATLAGLFVGFVVVSVETEVSFAAAVSLSVSISSCKSCFSVLTAGRAVVSVLLSVRLAAAVTAPAPVSAAVAVVVVIVSAVERVVFGFLLFVC